MNNPKLSHAVQKAGPHGGGDTAGAILDLAEVIEELAAEVASLRAEVESIR